MVIKCFIILRVKKSRPNLFAYMMGFKYCAYYGDHVKDVSKPPLQIIFVTALLIKENLMSLGDIYPHLYPSDENINYDYDEYLKFCKDMGAKSARYQGPTVF